MDPPGQLLHQIANHLSIMLILNVLKAGKEIITRLVLLDTMQLAGSAEMIQQGSHDVSENDICIISLGINNKGTNKNYV